MTYEIQTGSIEATRPFWPAMKRGMAQTCPACGQGKLFSSYLKVNDKCPNCGEAYHHHEADDAPPYFTIFIVGHIVVPAMLVVEKLWRPELMTHALIWLPLTLALSLTLLPITKGAVVAAQWAKRMHGFSTEA